MAASTSEDSVSKQVPKDIVFEDMIIDISCHPTKDVIASGQIDGDINIHSYSTVENNHLLMTLTHHKKSCRTLCFSGDGDRLYSASKDKSVYIIDMNNGRTIHKFAKAHDEAIYSMCVVDEFKFATGDDDGTLKLWDTRQPEAIMMMKETDEFISDLYIDNGNKFLLATSGEGTLTAFNIRRRRMELQSELFDSELLSLAAVKKENKVVCGSGDGVLNIFNWGQWGNMSDRFPGHPMSIDCMVAISEDIVCTGSMDGMIRAVNILPNRFLGIVGEHNEFPVENLSLSHDGHILASCSHDQKIKFWNVEDIKKENIDTRKKAKKGTKTKILQTTTSRQSSDFFADLLEKPIETETAADEDNDDTDGSDSD